MSELVCTASTSNIVNIEAAQSSEEINLNKSTFNFDIGLAVNKTSTDNEKYHYIKNTWIPDKNYKFPFSEHNKNQKVVRRYLSHAQLEKYNWLSFSHEMQGIFCKFCVLFAHEAPNLQLKSLITQPVKKFAKLFGADGVIDMHDSHLHHKRALLAANNFIKCYKNPDIDVRNLLSQTRANQIKDNRNRLIPIIKTIIFLGRQNISFRGHRDDGSLLAEDVSSTNDVNDGNFRQLLRFRVDAGDSNLKEHLTSASAKATYISKKTQNDLIDCCKEEIVSVLLNKIKNAVFFLCYI